MTTYRADEAGTRHTRLRKSVTAREPARGSQARMSRAGLMWGRLLGYGTLTITGTGGTRESLSGIPRPLEFRRHVQSQIVDLDERRGRDPMGALPAGESRVERDCPWCAERILARARVCKHCGREVTPAD